MRILNNKKASGYIDGCVLILVFVMVVLVITNVSRMIVVNQMADEICDHLLDTATSTGCFGTAFQQEYQVMQQQYGAFIVDTSSGSGVEVQLGERMSLTVTIQTQMQVFGDWQIPITATVTKHGLSERYWK